MPVSAATAGRYTVSWTDIHIACLKVHKVDAALQGTLCCRSLVSLRACHDAFSRGAPGACCHVESGGAELRYVPDGARPGFSSCQTAGLTRIPLGGTRSGALGSLSTCLLTRTTWAWAAAATVAACRSACNCARRSTRASSWQAFRAPLAHTPLQPALHPIITVMSRCSAASASTRETSSCITSSPVIAASRALGRSSEGSTLPSGMRMCAACTSPARSHLRCTSTHAARQRSYIHDTTYVYMIYDLYTPYTTYT